MLAKMAVAWFFNDMIDPLSATWMACFDCGAGWTDAANLSNFTG